MLDSFLYSQLILANIGKVQPIVDVKQVDSFEFLGTQKRGIKKDSLRIDYCPSLTGPNGFDPQMVGWPLVSRKLG